MSVNKATLIGNLGADPEIRRTQNGDMATLRLATSETWKDRDGHKQERTEWHNIVIFSEGLVRVAEEWLRKGSQIYIEGQIRTRKWQDQKGDDRYSTEIVLQGPGAVLRMLGEAGRGGGRDDRRDYRRDDRDRGRDRGDDRDRGRADKSRDRDRPRRDDRGDSRRDEGSDWGRDDRRDDRRDEGSSWGRDEPRDERRKDPPREEQGRFADDLDDDIPF